MNNTQTLRSLIEAANLISETPSAAAVKAFEAAKAEQTAAYKAYEAAYAASRIALDPAALKVLKKAKTALNAAIAAYRTAALY
jgi:hypothetical protein